MNHFYTNHCFENIDMDIHNKLSFESNAAIVCAIVYLALFIINCCWIVPIIARRCSERSEVQEHQPEHEVEMQQLGREINPNDISHPLENEQFHIQSNQDNNQAYV